MGNSVVTKFGGDDHNFEFNLEQIEELQRLCGNVGIGVIIERTLRNEFFISDIHHTIRLGLIGGGCNAVRAKQLVDTYGLPIANPEDPSSPLSVAKVVLASIMFGVEEKVDQKKPEAEGEKDSSTSPQSELQPSEQGSTLSQ